MNIRIMVAALAAVLALAACSQKDPAREAIDAAEGALNAVYEDAGKYLPERYAAVKADLDTARTAFGEERYADAIAAVKDVPAAAEALAKDAAAAREKHISGLNADWARIAESLPGLLAGIGGRIEDLGQMRKLPEGMDRQLLDETKAAFASAQSAWSEASTLFGNGDLENAVARARAAEGMAQDLVARLGMPAG
ncbi:MAG TPA: hypothetical protein VNO53_07230 [Steroidobacteraceae bacterium]|nr:hypothetical protein [Steroidobacteraceae bacterium]